jgi:hypothetical protein
VTHHFLGVHPSGAGFSLRVLAPASPKSRKLKHAPKVPASKKENQPKDFFDLTKAVQGDILPVRQSAF